MLVVQGVNYNTVSYCLTRLPFGEHLSRKTVLKGGAWEGRT